MEKHSFYLSRIFYSGFGALLTFLVVFLFFQTFTDSTNFLQAQTTNNSSGGCVKWDSGDTSLDSLYSGFGVPWNVLSPQKELLIRATCAPNEIQLMVGNDKKEQYIWQNAYISKNGGSWERISLEGGAVVKGGWFRGGAFVRIPSSNFAVGEKNYLLAYICTSQGNQWKCGCRDANTCTSKGKWQLQEVNHTDGQVSGFGNPSTALTQISFDSPSLFYPSDYVVSRGKLAYLWGGGFEPGQEVFFEGYGGVSATVNNDGTGMKFTVPTNIPYGKYNIWIKDENKNSNTSFLIVKDPSKPSPSASFVVPSRVSPGENVTIQGSGFLPEGNEVRTNLGVVSDISSQNGRELSFTLPGSSFGKNQAIPEAMRNVMNEHNMSETEFRNLQEEAVQNREKKEMKGALRVINDNGLSRQVEIIVEL